MNGIEKIILLMKSTKFNGTFSSLCFLLEAAVYNDESQDVANLCGIFNVLATRFNSDKWREEDVENTKINTLDMIATLSKYEKNQINFREKIILSNIIDLIFNTMVQSVISSSLKCLMEILPTLDDLRIACTNFKVEELFAKIVLHCNNPSIYVQNAAAMCIAQLCSRIEHQNMFLELSDSRVINILLL